MQGDYIRPTSGSSDRLSLYGLRHLIPKRLRLGPFSAADEEAELAATGERAPNRICAWRRLAFGPAAQDFLARKRRGARPEQGLQGAKQRGVRRRAVGQHDVVRPLRIELGSGGLKRAWIPAHACEDAATRRAEAPGDFHLHY